MEDSIRKAEVYKQYYSDPAFREPWDEVRAAFVKRWQTTDAGEHNVRENIYRYLSLMDKLDKFVGDVIASGEIEKAKLEALIKFQNGPNPSAYN
ncbi:hypothetical protein [Methylobacterium sp.]|uniref:hypothetical protein n=1 Tax=Methylobacterium sp. TaxID=409 RepID=UPI000FAACF86|nr:hypothetical protein [Methylobacterium sp.]RUP22660.1 MAG: hypothetical protein EKK44_04115 [Methylobacterium sp.]